MTPSTHQLLYALPGSVPFVDHTRIDWSQVRSTHSWIYQRYSYEYPGPVKDMHQRLIIGAAAALALAGPGKLSVDNLLFGSRTEQD
jgi:hypothetical protein